MWSARTARKKIGINISYTARRKAEECGLIERLAVHRAAPAPVRSVGGFDLQGHLVSAFHGHRIIERQKRLTPVRRLQRRLVAHPNVSDQCSDEPGAETMRHSVARNGESR